LMICRFESTALSYHNAALALARPNATGAQRPGQPDRYSRAAD
jgi:hypothetical protein